jgi:polyphosphate:AMP phosphotransferase
MFETAELGRKLSKDEYRARVPELRTQLLEMQRNVHRAGDFSVLVLVNGVDGAGKGEVIQLLNDWMDTRNLQTIAFSAPTEEERHRPPYWRYWMSLPPRGTIGIFAGAWYTESVLRRVYGEIDDAELGAALQRIYAFERALADDGALLVKLWLHVSKKEQRKKLTKLEEQPDTAWRVSKLDWKHARLYDEFRRVCERVIRVTSTGATPWSVVESTDPRYRNVSVAEELLGAIQRRLARPSLDPPKPPAPVTEDPVTILDSVDLTTRLERDAYRSELERLQGELNRLGRRANRARTGTIVVLEGADAAGKGGAIRRITAALDARQYRVIQIAAPTDEERARHYLWRFWRHLPRLGRFTIYDRSWYGRVLVERVEGLAREAEWMRAYKEINEFEEQLVEHGIVLVKLWLQISDAEQLRRFQEREQTPWKQYKITDEDYRNRAKSHAYEAATNEMIERTSTDYAPWMLISAEDKRSGRVQVLRTLCDRLGAALQR